MISRIPRRGAAIAAALLGTVLIVCAGVAGAAPLGQIVEFNTPGTDPAQIQAGPDGNLWFSDRTGSVGRATPDGVITRFTTGLNPGSAVRSIAMGPDGNMWFSDPGTTRAVGVINPFTQAISEFSAGLNPGSMPLGIAAGPDGNVWFTDSGTTKAIGVINPTTHAISEFSAGLNPGSNLQQGLVAGPDGNLWFTDQGTTPAIGRIDPNTHAITEFSAGLNAGSKPGASIVVGPDGGLWFMDGSNPAAIGRIDPTTQAITEFRTGLNPGAALGRLAAGPDGNIWFGDKGVTPGIGMINPTTHAIVMFSAGLNAGSLPGGMGTGPDGNVWFTDQATAAGSSKAIGRTGVDAPAASVTPPFVAGGSAEGVTQSCSGAAWANWAGAQPSLDRFGFDGYRWRLDGVPVVGATSQTYTPVVADLGHQLSCVVTVTYTLFPTTVSAVSVPVVVVDATAPALTLPSTITVDATSPRGASMSYTASATDNVDSNPAVACTPSSGSTFPIGTSTVQCSTTDAAGNSAAGSFTVVVNGAVAQLDELAAAIDGVGRGKTLAATVSLAKGLLAVHAPRLACLALGVVDIELTLQSGRTIPTAQAAALIADSRRITAVIGC
jgi:streptogramin lyase